MGNILSLKMSTFLALEIKNLQFLYFHIWIYNEKKMRTYLETRYNSIIFDFALFFMGSVKGKMPEKQEHVFEIIIVFHLLFFLYFCQHDEVFKFNFNRV